MRGACINTKNEPEFDEQNVPELCGSRRLLLEEVTLEGEIEEVDGVLNFYLACWFDVDQVFGTHVETTENGDWINVYANYDMRTRHVCGVLDVVLHREDGSDEFYIYKLDEEERMVVLSKMEDYCVQRTGQTLVELCEMYLEPPDHPVMERRMR